MSEGKPMSREELDEYQQTQMQAEWDQYEATRQEAVREDARRVAAEQAQQANGGAQHQGSAEPQQVRVPAYTGQLQEAPAPARTQGSQQPESVVQFLRGGLTGAGAGVALGALIAVVLVTNRQRVQEVVTEAVPQGGGNG